MGRRAFKYRIYPTRAQAVELDTTLRLCRELYNACLEERREAWKKGVSLTGYEQKRALPAVKEARPEFARIYSQVLQDVVMRLDKAFKGFFRRVKAGQKAGYPRFRGRDRYDSFTFPQVWRDGGWAGPGRLNGVGNKVYVPGIGNVRVKLHRPVEGAPKTATIKREGCSWYIVYSCECPDRVLAETGSGIGLDLGLTHFVVTSDGEFVGNPRHFRAAQKKLRVAQRSLSRRKRGSSRRRKAKERVARLHRKVANQRRDFHHKTANALVNAHDLIAHEDLNVIGLARTRLAKSVHDAGWSQFIAILTSKAESAGRQVVAVDPRFTSQDCAGCGHREKHPLSVREFTCAGCGARQQRDLNAAMNVLLRAGMRPSGSLAVGRGYEPRSPAF